MTTTEIICEIVAPSIIAILGGNSLLTWWLQTRLEHRLKRDMADHEAKLTQQNFRFSTVFKTTEETIANLYALLLPILDSAEDYTMLMQNRTPKEKLEKLKEFSNRCDAFYALFRPKKIYVPIVTAKLINDTLNDIIKLVQRYNMSQQLESLGELSEDGKASLAKIEKQMDILKDNMMPALRAIENDFQNILGFPVPNKSITTGTK